MSIIKLFFRGNNKFVPSTELLLDEMAQLHLKNRIRSYCFIKQIHTRITNARDTTAMKTANFTRSLTREEHG